MLPENEHLAWEQSRAVKVKTQKGTTLQQISPQLQKSFADDERTVTISLVLTILGTVQTLPRLILAANLWSIYCSDPHCTNEETEAWGGLFNLI